MARSGGSVTGDWSTVIFVSVLLLSCARPCDTRAAEMGRLFATPEAAVSALEQAAETTNHEALAALFGPASEELVNHDSEQFATELAAFATAFNATNRLVRKSDTRMVLEVGTNAWQFPVQLVKQAGGWQFDTQTGLREVQNRRIGRDELDTLRAMRAYVDAQREYASRDRDEDGVLEFAQKLISSPRKTDGLYWPPDLTGEISPLGPLFAEAQATGNFSETNAPDTGPRPFHGYWFKILTGQGKHAPGGKYHYIINGKMLGGFALVAWPAEYKNSGIMTFIVNQQGRVYEKDLGPKTSRLAPALDAYDPDPSWTLSAN